MLQFTAPAKWHISSPFNASMLGCAIKAVIDLSDPLRTNVKLFLADGACMYADMFTIQNLNDPSGAANRIVRAWEKAMAPESDGCVHVNLVRMPAIPGIPGL